MPNRQFLRPYAALAKVQHAFDVNHLDIWVIFRFPMDRTVKPPNAIWIVEVDSVVKAVTASAWQDEWTMLLTVAGIATRPEKVTIEYDGPSPLLTTTWFKQWEPWGAIVSDEIQPIIIPLILTGTFVSFGLDVSDIETIFFDTTGGNVLLGGFINGINGQIIHLVKTDDAVAGSVTLLNNFGSGNQDLFLHAGANETLAGEFGGWYLACNGSNWYDVSHAKHV